MEQLKQQDSNSNLESAILSIAKAIQGPRLTIKNGEVDTSQTTTSTSYTNLTTTGPTVTVDIGPRGIMIITLYAQMASGTATANDYMSFDMSGKNTFSATDAYCNMRRANDANSAGIEGQSATFIMTGLTPGATTITAKYRVNAGTGTFVYRKIGVITV